MVGGRGVLLPVCSPALRMEDAGDVLLQPLPLVPTSTSLLPHSEHGRARGNPARPQVAPAPSSSKGSHS